MIYHYKGCHFQAVSERLRVDQQVFRFNVSVDDFIFMEIVDSLAQLVNITSYIFRLKECLENQFLTTEVLTSRPLLLCSRTSSKFFSTYSNTRQSLPFLNNKTFSMNFGSKGQYLLKASLRWTTLSFLSILRILTSLRVLFLTLSSSSDSLNFLIATT